MFLDMLHPIGKGIYRCAVSNGLVINIAVFNRGTCHYSLRSLSCHGFMCTINALDDDRYIRRMDAVP
jgi:hypothetical protein